MEGQQLRVRVRCILLVLAVILTAFVWVLYDLQVNQYAAFAAQSQRRIARTETVSASRGEIVDRYGRMLVDNLPSYNVSIDTSYMGEARNDILLGLVRICRDQGVVWSDTLPVSAAPPFVFTLSSATTGSANNFRKYVEKLDKAESFRFSATLIETMNFSTYPGDAEKLMTLLRTTYEVDPALSDQEARDLVGVLYELALRSKEVSQVAYVFAQDVNIDFITAVKEQKLTGVDFIATAVRRYHTEYAAHLLGRVGPIFSEEWDYYKALGYSYNATVGKDGLEKAFEQYLQGTSGVRAIETNKAGKVVGETWKVDAETGEPQIPVPGNNVMVTIDFRLQGAVERSLADVIPTLSEEAEGGAAVVMDMQGGVLAMASYPTFDLTQYGAQFTELVVDPLNPMLNRATMEYYPPGSTFKMVTAVGALEEGIITPTTKIRDTGRYLYYPNKADQPMCWLYRQNGGTHGNISLSTALEVSCNVFFYDIGRRLGIEKLDEYAAMFGLGEKTGIEIPEMKGVVSGPQYTEGVLGQTWHEGNIMSASIGQENSQFTPLQLANYVATLVNGGTHYEAHLLKTVKSGDYSQVIFQQEPVVLDTIDIDPANLEAVKEGMLRVATKSNFYKGLPFNVGAKTGSAQVNLATDSNAVYVCFAPYDDPQIAIAIVVEHGGAGGGLGAIAEDILEFYFSSDSTLEGIAGENTLIR